ncbi:MAG: AmmeMemoRadiSam system protein B, partial [Deltaproteobacteria bacterium]|nr:AmmeMemoRadiSam system protein B [Deltaproteobacteria bacterium]
MATVLARLRDDLDFLPSPLPERPGLLVRDPYRYSDAAIVLPPLLVRCLTYFDGAHTDADLRAMVARLTGRIDLSHSADELARGLSEGGFLDDEAFRAMRAERRRAFAASAVRKAAFAGGGYPDDQPTLSQTVSTWIDAAPAPAPGVEAAPLPTAVSAIAAPHASPAGAISSYGAAYRTLGRDLTDRTFVILGTS